MRRTGTHKKSRIAVLCSGGLESCILLAEMSQQYDEVFPVYIRSNLAWESAELHWLRKYIRTLRAVSLHKVHVLRLPVDDLLKNHWSITGKEVPGARTQDDAVYLPGRNIILFSKGALFCAVNDIPHITFGSLQTNPFPDATHRFLKSLQQTLREGLQYPIKLVLPYTTLTKQEVLIRGVHLPLHLSFSCIAPVHRMHCGKCNKCAERKQVFRVCSIPDPTRYTS